MSRTTPATMNIGGGDSGGRRRRIMASLASNGRKDRGDELALFQDMVKREKERNMSLLHPISDEFEPSNPGMNPLYRISSGKKGLARDHHLRAEGGKNDYDWLKTPPATPLFPSLEMEANHPNLTLQREIPLLLPPKPSRFAGKRSDPKPINRHKSPAPEFTTSSRTTSLIPAAGAPQMVESKRGAEKGRRPPPSETRGRKVDVALAQRDGEQKAVATGGTQMGSLVLGSRMVEKVMKARSAAAAGGGGVGGGERKGVKPNERGGPKVPFHGKLPSLSSHDVGTKHTGTRMKPANGDQRQSEGHPKGLEPRSNASSSASTPRTPRGLESREDRNLLKKVVRRGKFGMC